MSNKIYLCILLLLSGLLIGHPRIVAADTLTPSAWQFTVPAANACQSAYDQFYMSEAGVYAFWAMCEGGNDPVIYDYAGQYDLNVSKGAWSSGGLSGGVSGPVNDGEGAIQVSTAQNYIESQNLLLNKNAGTLSIWINSSATAYPVSTIFASAVSGSSLVSITVNTGTGANSTTLCFNGNLKNTIGIAAKITDCGYIMNTWHRVTMTWSNQSMNLYVDGVLKQSSSYSGTLDNKVFYYKLFPGCCATGKQMTLAKALISNIAWNSAQVELDYNPILITPPTGGLYVTNNQLGTIHSDVLGYSDDNSDLSTPDHLSALIKGLQAGGFTSVRYAGGYGGIGADTENWQGGVVCTSLLGQTAPAQNVSTMDNLDTYMTAVVLPLGLHAGYTVNYGSNPPLCNAGGDPIQNGADLVDYANNVKHYNIKYWEIGNEQYQGFAGGSELDFHSNPGTATSYDVYEPEFYSDMKAKDSTIQIGVPAGFGTYTWDTNFGLPVLANAQYDAIIMHNYPLSDPIADGTTLYPDLVASNRGRTRGRIANLQTVLLSNNKSPDSIWITEWSGDAGGDEWSRQTLGAAMPLFATMELAEYMRAGVQYATWWAQSQTDGCLQFYYDWTANGAYNWWNCGGAFLTYTNPYAGEVAVGFQPGDLTPSARAFQLLSQSGFVTEGEHMLQTWSDVQNAPWLMSYAATHNSSYALILINRDPTAAHIVPVQIAGNPVVSAVTQWTYGREQYDQSRNSIWSVGPTKVTSGGWTGTFQATLPAWSVNILIFENSGYTTPNPPAQGGALIPSTYFGLSTLHYMTDVPSILYGLTRSWDGDNLSWAQINTFPGVYNFAAFDKFVAFSQANSSPMIYTFGRTPRWSSSQPFNLISPYGAGECASPSNLANWDNYVRSLVIHAAGRIKYWELWNDAANQQSYCGSMSTMVLMAQHAYSLIKSLDSSAIVLSPSVSGTNGAAWLNSFLKGGGGRYVDGIAFHGMPGETAESIGTIVPAYTAVMQENGVFSKPLFDTQTSWSTGVAPTLSSAQEAGFVAKYYLLDWSLGVSSASWYGYDSATTAGQLWNSTSGLSAAGIAYGQIYSWMVGATMSSACSIDSDKIWACTLTRTNGYQAQATWITNSSMSVTVPALYTQYRDLTGAVHPITNNTVTIGDQPVLLENQSP